MYIRTFFTVFFFGQFFNQGSFFHWLFFRRLIFQRLFYGFFRFDKTILWYSITHQNILPGSFYWYSKRYTLCLNYQLAYVNRLRYSNQYNLKGKELSMVHFWEGNVVGHLEIWMFFAIIIIQMSSSGIKTVLYHLNLNV